MVLPVSMLSVAGKLATETYSEFGPFQPDKPISYLERQYTNENSAFIEIGDSRIHYREHGNPADQTLVLIHGTYSSLHTWNDWVTELTTRFHVVRLDLPGFGLTGPRTNGEHRLEYLIDTVGRFCDALDLTNVALIGNSLGGGIAWRLTVDRPDLVSRLVLIDAGGATLLARLAGNLMSFGSDLVPRFLTPRVLIRLIVKDAYYDDSKITPKTVRRYHELLLRPGNRRAVIEIARNYAADHKMSEVDDVYDPHLPTLPSKYEPTPDIVDNYEISEVSVPTLFQWGAEDEWLPVEFGRGLASYVPDTQFIIYDGVGHLPMEESPVRTVRDVIEFLAD